MSTPDASGAQLLIIDDNSMNRDLLTRLLERLGHRVQAAEDGESGLAALRADSFDLVLLDITMPGMDGYEVLETIKADPSLSHLPVIMVSALTEAETVARCLQIGAEDYLNKPFKPLLLRARVEACLARKRLHDLERDRLHALQRELEIGREIQAGFLPDSLPQPAGWQIAARFLPARQVAGDFYDAFELGGGRIAIVVADVCDKGVGAALYMALFRSLIRATATHSGLHDATEILQRTARTTNDYIAQVHDRANMFATAFVAVLDPADGSLRYLNAGHEAPFLMRGQSVDRLDTTGPALGMMGGAHFEVAQAVVGHGERLFVFTDGVTEAGAPQATFGEQGILAHLDGAHAAETMLDTIGARLDAIATERWDDVTMLAVSRDAA